MTFRSSNDSQIKPFLTAVGLLWLSSCGGDPTATEPELVFTDGFDSDPTQVEIVDEGGTRVRGYDAWLKLLPRGDLRPRYEQAYQYCDCREPAGWFNRVMHRQELVPERGGLVCLEYTNPKFNFDHGRWLVEDRHTGHIYFRVWKSY